MMNEIIKIVVSKTGISESMARKIIEIVIAQLKKRLPEGIGGQLESLLGDTSAKGSKSAGDQLGGLVGKLGGMLGKK
ncbi:MAG: hypothetical protein WC377_07980 [Bacteroidales bacterium]|jgi:hypothetical protein|nr:hypothetical protein [Bacteroidales bacterium]MDD3101380.1 hypothetical protein [Bacteroidales bacterium]MDD3640044.1 hypothetical protein [Bacteroidales bacterium]MDD3945221.1 hypothetical protein [Bacteroidales bacterium]MDD4481481.1 hypothetical protein [Bacteroidales bacterium]